MKLYTREQLIAAYNKGLMNAKNDILDVNLLDGFLPIELPSDDYSRVHLRHCYQREYEDCCKYGEDDCPAKPLETLKQQDNGK
jgi:hypothetical protein